MAMTSNSPSNDPSIPDPRGLCFYLDLPRELRDIIHSYALTYNGDLVCTPKEVLWMENQRSIWFPKLEPTQLHERPPKQDIDGVLELGDPNPLRLVCHQTRAETRGLLLDSNNISFCRRTKDCYNGLEVSDIDFHRVFELFYNQCGPTNKDRLRRITIHMSHYPVARVTKAYNFLAQYARDYAHHHNISFILRFNSWVGIATNYLFGTQILSLLFRGTAPDVPLLRESAFCTTSLQRWQDEKSNSDLGTTSLPQNVRFTILEEFPEDTVKAQWRRMCGKCDKVEQQEKLCTCAEDIAASQKVFEDGI